MSQAVTSTCTRCGQSVDWPTAEDAARYGNVHARVCPADEPLRSRATEPDDVGVRYLVSHTGSSACRLCGAIVGMGLTARHDAWHAALLKDVTTASAGQHPARLEVGP